MLKKSLLFPLCFVLFFGFFNKFTSAQSIQKGGTVVIGIPYKLSQINPFKTRSSFSANILEIIFDTLVQIDQDFKIYPHLASSWQKSSDLLTWTFTLNQNILFHDNKPLTTQDILFTFQTLKKLNQNHLSDSLKNIKNISIIDAKKIQFELFKPDQTFLFLLSRIYIAPKHLFQENGEPISTNYYAKPIGSGAFYIDHFSEKSASLKNFANYFKSKAYLDEVKIKIFENEKILLSKLILNEIDIKFFFDSHYVQTTKNIPHINLTPYNNQHLFAIFFNFKNSLFQNPQIRQALNLAVRKKNIVKNLNSLFAKPAATIVAPQNRLLNQNILPYEDNAKVALQIFNQNGWKIDTKSQKLVKDNKNFEFEVLMPQNSYVAKEIFQMTQADLDRIGITITPKFLTMPEWIQMVFAKKDFDTTLFPYSNLYSIDFESLFWANEKSNFNFTSYKNPLVRKALENAKYTISEESSHQYYHKFQTLIHDDAPAIYILWKSFPVGINKRVQGITSDPYLFCRNLRKVWVQN